jgi:hypothetical protein
MVDQLGSVTQELSNSAAAMAAAAAAAAAAAPWKGLGSALRSSQLSNRLRSVGAAAVEGASSFVTAAVDGWASDVLRHFDLEVQLQEEQQAAAAAAAAGTQPPAAAAAAAAVDAVDADLVLVLEQQSAADDGVLPGSSVPPSQEALAAAYTSAAAADSVSTAAVADANSSSSSEVAETLVGAFEILEGAPADAVGDVLCCAKPAAAPLTLQELQSVFMDVDGVMVDAAGFRQRVFAAGGCVSGPGGCVGRYGGCVGVGVAHGRGAC